MAKPSVMLQINIPRPCHEDWNQMTPTNRGAFCNACAKDVVDFTRMSDAEVQHYLLNKAGDKICGKFNNTQLHRIRITIPNHLFYAKIAGWKKFMAVVLLAFGSMLFGCDVATDAAGKKEPVKIEKTNEDYGMVGMMVMPVLPNVDSATINCTTTQGEPAMIEAPPTVTMGITTPVITGDIEILPDTVIAEEYEMVGKIAYTDTTRIKQLKKDSLPKIKLPADSANCVGERFY